MHKLMSLKFRAFREKVVAKGDGEEGASILIQFDHPAAPRFLSVEYKSK